MITLFSIEYRFIYGFMEELLELYLKSRILHFFEKCWTLVVSLQTLSTGLQELLFFPLYNLSPTYWNIIITITIILTAQERQSRDELESQEYEVLAKLPLPPLADTMAQYLDNVRPLVSEAVYLQVRRGSLRSPWVNSDFQTKQVVERFGQRDGVGEKVIQLLEERGERLENWAYEYWLADMYLNVRWVKETEWAELIFHHIRLPLPVHSNPAMVFPKRKFSNPAQMLSYTSRYYRKV